MANTEENSDIITNQITIIMGAIDNDECFTALNETDLLIKMLPKELQTRKTVNKLQKRLNNFLLNQNNVRILRLLQKLKGEVDTAIEYYDQDIGTDERLNFQQQLEEDLLQTYAEIRETIGWLLREEIGGELEI